MSEILETKDPSDSKDYAIEWASLLTAETETAIATSTWSVSTPTGLTIATTPPPSIVGTKTIVWVSGGSAGTMYALANTIVTTGVPPRTHQRSIIIPCADR